MGDTVNIRTRGSVPIHEGYAKGMQLDPPDYIESPSIQLLIDKSTYFYYGIDDVDKYQTDLPLMNEWASDATEQDKIVIDTRCLAYIYGEAAAKNQGATAGIISGLYNLGVAGAPIQLTSSNILKYYAMMRAVLGEYNIPESNNFVIIPEAAAALLRMSDIKDASFVGGASSLRDGRVGKIMSFMTYASNLLPSVVDGTTGQLCFYIIFGHPLGLTFASQFIETNYIDKPERTFGKFVKSLHVYGRKVIKPSAIGVLYATPILT